MTLGIDWQKNCVSFLKKYKYLALMVVLGVGILLLPTGRTKEETAVETSASASDDLSYAARLEERLEEILGLIEGAGEVRVVLTLHTGSRTEYQMDVQSSQETGETDSRSSQERKTVILSESSAYDTAAICAVAYPVFQGALVLCQGAERPAVRLALTEAVAALTGLNSSQITVVKMK